MKNNILLFISLLICSNLFAQFPVGKNIKSGEKEIRTILQSKGYHYLKTWKDSLKDGNRLNILYFSEEFTVALHINIYENIYLINFCGEKAKVIDNLINKFDFKKWALVNESNTSEHDKSFYTFKNYKIEYDKSDRYKLFQFLVKEKE